MAHDAFISHSVKNKATADAVCAMLESEGIRCWIAPRDVTPGMEWGECIIDAIEHSRIMVLVFSADANASPQIRREVERAVNHGVAILPVRIEDVLPAKALEYFIGNVHWLDALTPPLEAHLKNLAGTIKMLLARMPLVEEQTDSTPPRKVAPPVPDVPPPVPLRAVAEHGEPHLSEPQPMSEETAVNGSVAFMPSRIGAAAGTQPSDESSTPRGSERRMAGTSGGERSRWKIPIWAGIGALLLAALAIAFFVFTARQGPAGEPWAARNSFTTNNLNAISGTADGAHLWVAGDGLILQSDDRGANWTKRDAGSLVSIFGTSDGRMLWAISRNCGLLLSVDGGSRWAGKDLDRSYSDCVSINGSGDGKHLLALHFDDRIWESSDSFATWTPVDPVSDGKDYSLYSTFEDADGKRIWVVGAGLILESNDFGANWVKYDTPELLYCVFGIDNGTQLWAVGNQGAVLRSTDGGARWVKLSSHVGNALLSVFASSDAKHVWAVGTGGIIIESNDGGNHWSRDNSGTERDLHAVFGTSDGRHVWAVGDGGTILELDSGS